MAAYFKRYINIDETAQLTGLTRKEIVRGIQSGRFPATQQGKFYHLNPVEIGMTLKAETAEKEEIEVPEIQEDDAIPAESFTVEDAEQEPEAPAEGMQLFSNESFGSLRVVQKDGEPWFVAADVCKALELTDTNKAASRLDDDEKGTNLIRTPGGMQEMIVVSEAGLYTLTLGSRKPEAKAFKRWVTHEVIPSIRKHGAYMTAQTIENIMADPANFVKLAQALADEKEKTGKLEAQNTALIVQQQKDKPKVDFADSFVRDDGAITVGELAVLLNERGYETGEKRLYETLRQEGYLTKTGTEYNLPTQKSLSLSRPIFRVREYIYKDSAGVERVSRTTRVTRDGQAYFYKHFCGDKFTRAGEAEQERQEKQEQTRAGRVEDTKRMNAARAARVQEAAETIRRIAASFGSDPEKGYYTAAEMKERFPIALADFNAKEVGRAMWHILNLEMRRKKNANSSGSTRAYLFPVEPLEQKKEPEIEAPQPVPELLKPQFIPAWHNAENDIRRILDMARVNKSTVWKWQTSHEFIASHPELAGYLPHTVDMELTKLCMEAKVQYNRVYRNLPVGKNN